MRIECKGCFHCKQHATLKREHAQLKAAAEQARAFFDRRPRTVAVEADALRAALDATTAEPVRETFDPVWVLHQLEGLSFSEQGSACDHMKRCIDSARAASASERKP